MRPRQAIEQMMVAIMINTMRNRRAYGSAPLRKGEPGSLSRPRRRLGIYILASALLMVSIIAVAWNGQRAKAKSVPTFIANQYGDAGGNAQAIASFDNSPLVDIGAFKLGSTTLTPMQSPDTDGDGVPDDRDAPCSHLFLIWKNPLR